MSMIWPPQRVKIVSTPSFFSAFATRWPPEATPACRLFRCRVSSAVVECFLSIVSAGAGTGLTLAMVPYSSRGPSVANGLVCEMGLTDRKVSRSQRLQDQQRESGSQKVEAHGDHENRAPAV